MQTIKKNRLAPNTAGILAVLALLTTAAPVSGQTVDEADLADSFSRETLVIEASAGACYPFEVYLALTQPEHRRGLMFVRQLARQHGMLFVYPDADMRSMWMKNTYIPLDMLFIRADGTIASIATGTEPLSLQAISSGEPVTYVLELNAGVSEALGIDTESRVLLPDPPAP